MLAQSDIERVTHVKPKMGITTTNTDLDKKGSPAKTFSLLSADEFFFKDLRKLILAKSFFPHLYLSKHKHQRENYLVLG